MLVNVGKLEIIGAALIVALFCGDLISTHIILSGGGVELNPFTRPLWEAGIFSVLLHEIPLYAVLILGTVIISGRIRHVSKECVRLGLARYFVWAVVLSMFAIPLTNNLCVILL